MTGDLVAFLRARLDEDEQVARRACNAASDTWHLDEELGETVLWWPPEPRVAEHERRLGLRVISDQWRGQTIESSGQDIAPHIARHDPARVLAEVDAKRRMVGEHELQHQSYPVRDGKCYCHGRPLPAEPVKLTWCSTCHSEDDMAFEAYWHGDPGGPCTTLRLLALPHCEHPDYQPAWAPEEG